MRSTSRQWPWENHGHCPGVVEHSGVQQQEGDQKTVCWEDVWVSKRQGTTGRLFKSLLRIIRERCCKSSRSRQTERRSYQQWKAAVGVAVPRSARSWRGIRTGRGTTALQYKSTVLVKAERWREDPRMTNTTNRGEEEISTSFFLSLGFHDASSLL